MQIRAVSVQDHIHKLIAKFISLAIKPAADNWPGQIGAKFK